jgi:hypothetical protein
MREVSTSTQRRGENTDGEGDEEGDKEGEERERDEEEGVSWQIRQRLSSM